MPSVWFQGGIDRLIAQSDYWASTPLNVALIGNGAVNAPSDIVVGDHSAVTLQNFIDLGNTLIGSGDRAVPGKTSLWTGSRWDMRFTGQVNMGVINNLDPISGAVIYEGNRASPSSATVVMANKFLTVGGGADVLWGNVGTNTPGYLNPRTDSNNTAFRGTLQHLVLGTDEWLTGTYNVGFALVLETGIIDPSQTVITLADLGATYCDGAAPNNPVKEVPVAGRARTWAQITAQAMDMIRLSEGAGGTEIRWPTAGLTTGQVIDAVVTYGYTGAFSLSNAILLNWNEANYTIQANEDIKYGSTNTSPQGSTAVLTPELN